MDNLKRFQFTLKNKFNNNQDSNNNNLLDVTTKSINDHNKKRASTFHGRMFNDNEDETIDRKYFEKRERSITSYELQKRSPSQSPKSKLLTQFLFFERTMERVPNYKKFRIMVLGNSFTGKTNFIRRFVYGDFEDQHLPTISDVFETGLFLQSDDKLKQFDLELCDFSGDIKELYPEAYEEEILKADGFIVMYSRDNLESLSNVVETVADINILKSDAAVLVLENKSDLKYCSTNLCPKFQLINCRHMKVSAKDNEGIVEAITTLTYDMEDISSSNQ